MSSDVSSKPVIFVSFSGGRTSAYMAWWLKTNMSHKYEFVFVFANTGQEHDATLDFVHNCDLEWDLNLIWIEALTHLEEKKGCTHKVVSYETASRNGEPFEKMIKKYGIPNPDWPHCNRELKLNPIYSLKESMGFKRNHPMAVGIRADEIDRMSVQTDKTGVFYPLISNNPTTKAEVRHWWADQSFDLDLPEHLGNCKTCWKKSLRKLLTIAKYHPDYFGFFADMEFRYSGVSPRPESRVFFRQHMSVMDVMELSKQPFDEFTDHMPELQLDMLGHDINNLDIESDCGASCEAA